MLDSLLLPLNYTFMKLDFIVGLLQYFLFVCHSENSGCVREGNMSKGQAGWQVGIVAGEYACREDICMR